MNIRKKLILVIALLSYFVIAIDSSVVITALTKISNDLSLNQSTLSWVQNAYILSFGGFILIGGRLGDVFGRKRILNVSLILFGIGSVLAGAATSAMFMIIARLFQGIGAAILAPTSLALLMDNFKGEERVKAVAWYGSISGLGGSVGLVLGGFIASYSSWRNGFFINIPLVVFMLIISFNILKNTEIKNEKFDIYGTVTSVLGLFSLVYAINGTKNVVLWLLLSVALLCAFIAIESKTKQPIVPLHIFKSNIRTRAYLSRGLFVGAMMGFWFLISQYMQEVLHFTPLLTGLAFFPLTIFTFMGAIKVPAFVYKYGDKKTLILGLFLLLNGFFWLTFLNSQSQYILGIAIPMILLGLGQGFSMSPLTNLGIVNTKTEDAGVASGLVNVFHQIGGSLGISIMVSAGSNITNPVTSLHVGMLIGTIMVLFALLISLFITNEKNDS
ncbi:MFS transporter [Priestia aryabhattai]|uniref:MFS transporter n=1 Tax=Priestia TaxID=2800373 RepID=UPI00207A50A1|nr:MFS transporter [Priestia megaterium]USL39548.1 MFS transporter [Priestia megaterium]